MADNRNLNILLVDEGDDEVNTLMRLLEDTAPKFNINHYDPSYSETPENRYDCEHNEVVMLNSSIGEENLYQYIKKHRKNKNPPYTIVLSDTHTTGDVRQPKIPGVSENILLSELDSDSLGAALERAIQHTNFVADDSSATPLASYNSNISCISRNNSVHEIELPFNDIDIDKGEARIPGYDIERLIGVGGMSSVYLAVRESDGIEVAIKTLKPKLLTDDRIIDRFIEEYQIAKSINHKNVIRIYDQRFLDDFVFIVMDYLPGASLKSKTRQAIGPTNAVKYALDIASALIGLHDAGIVHRDIKPSNFHFDAHGRLMLLDFGVSKRINDDNDLTNHGEPIGTPQFMSPEQILEKPVDERSDLFSLGIIMYKMLTGTYPHKSTDTIDLMYKSAHEPHPEIPYKLLGLDLIVNKLLEKNPDDRYQNARDVYNDLIEVLMASDKLIGNV